MGFSIYLDAELVSLARLRPILDSEENGLILNHGYRAKPRHAATASPVEVGKEALDGVCDHGTKAAVFDVFRSPAHIEMFNGGLPSLNPIDPINDYERILLEV